MVHRISVVCNVRFLLPFTKLSQRRCSIVCYFLICLKHTHTQQLTNQMQTMRYNSLHCDHSDDERNTTRKKSIKRTYHENCHYRYSIGIIIIIIIIINVSIIIVIIIIAKIIGTATDYFNYQSESPDNDFAVALHNCEQL